MSGKQGWRICVGLALVAVGVCASVAAQPAAPDAEEPDAAEPPQLRTWTNATGKFQTEAAMIKFADGKVHLKQKTGRTLLVPVGKLSKADQQYVRAELARRAAGRREQPSGADVAATAAAGWPGWRGPLRDGKSPDRGLLRQWPDGGPELLWKLDNIGKGYSTVAVTGGRVYTTGNVNDRLMIFALDLDGKPQWQIEHGPAFTGSHPGSRATPMLDGGNLYLVSGNGLVGCRDAKTGESKWTRQMEEFGGKRPHWGYAESVLICGNLAVITPGGQNCIVALDKKSGRPVWTSQGYKGGAQYGSCYAFTYQGVSMIVTGTGEGLVCVDARDGRVLWTHPFSAHNTANCPTPVFADGYVFWANGYGKGGVCLELSVRGKDVSAREAWKTNDMVCHHGGYIIHEGYIYGNHSGGYACLDLKTGQKMWQQRAVGKGSLCFADGMLYLFGESGGKAALAIFSPQGMQLTGNFSVEGSGPSWAHPVVIGGRLYLRYDSNLYCFDVRAGGN